MDAVSKRFKVGEIFLLEIMLSVVVMHKGLDVINPLLAKSGRKGVGTIVIGTVEEDIHDIGKKIDGFLLEGNGFEAIDLSVDVQVSAFVQAIEKHKPQILVLSALLTTTIPSLGKTIELLKEKGSRGEVKIIVGSAPFDQNIAKSIGADGYAREAISGVELAKKLVGNQIIGGRCL